MYGNREKNPEDMVKANKMRIVEPSSSTIVALKVCNNNM
jgi:hypothetical protein